ncbi:MAG: HAMP domain-containing protein, partial [Planctomycetota bacterium]|nr:HAMP domain-containing protein [Planctomycetota bacterium]
MAVGISLANKCQLVFGFAVVAILAAALSVPWVRTRMLVREGQFEAARQLADAWLAKQIQLNPVELHGGPPLWINDLFDDPDTAALLRITIVEIDEIDTPQDGDPLIAAALRRFQKDEQVTEHTDTATVSGKTVYRYVRVLRESQLRALGIQFSSEPSDPAGEDPIRAVLVIGRTSEFAEGQLLLNDIYTIAAWIVAGLLAVLVFYLITQKLILSPVRELTRVAVGVSRGEHSIRSRIATGDEFEELARAFNAMLTHLEASENELRTINKSLDTRLGELAEHNVALFESNKLKG